MIDPSSNEFLSRIAVALERIAAVLEQGTVSSHSGLPDPRIAAIAELRQLMRNGNLVEAATLLTDFQIDFPDSAETPSLLEELDRTTQVAIEERRARLAAARKANSPEGALDIRDELVPLLSPSERVAVDRELLAWLMATLMKRLRTGTVRADVAILAARIAHAFPHYPEGASLKASLPTIRRSAGLCARCAEPYSGEEDSCPRCLAGAPKIAELPESPEPPT